MADESLAGRVVVLTGASGGIGRATARELGRRGAHVVMGYLDPGLAPDALIRLTGGQGVAMSADVRDDRSVAALIGMAAERHGRIDALVNNAGVMEQTPMRDLTTQAWQDTIDVNLSGAFRCVRAALPLLSRSPHAAVVNVSSQLAYTGAALAVAYCASKAGLLGLTRALAHDLGPDIRVNAVAPGPIETPMTAPHATAAWVEAKTSRLVMKRFGRAEEVAAAVRFLVSDESSYFTGQTLGPNGGGVMP